MKVFKWNVGMKGVAFGALGLIAATLLGKASTMEIEDSVTKLPPESKENEKDNPEDSEKEESQGEVLKPDEIIDKKDN